MLSRVSGRDLTEGMTCWRLSFLIGPAGTTESIRVFSVVSLACMLEDAVKWVGDKIAISFSMRNLIVSLDKAFFFAHCSMCVRFCLGVFLLVHCSPQLTHLDS